MLLWLRQRRENIHKCTHVEYIYILSQNITLKLSTCSKAGWPAIILQMYSVSMTTAFSWQVPTLMLPSSGLPQLTRLHLKFLCVSECMCVCVCLRLSVCVCVCKGVEPRWDEGEKYRFISLLSSFHFSLCNVVCRGAGSRDDVNKFVKWSEHE